MSYSEADFFSLKKSNRSGDISYRISTNVFADTICCFSYKDGSRESHKRYVLFSYGTHFPMAMYLGENKNGKKVFLWNVDKRSTTTIRHQSNALWGARQSGAILVNVSFSALERIANINYKDLTLENAVDYDSNSKNEYAGHTILYDKINKRYLKYSGQATVISPKIGMFVAENQSDKSLLPIEYQNDDYIVGYWHTPSGALLKINNNYYLSAMDEGSYFISKLSSSAKTIGEAFLKLMPKQARNVPHVRQGEWFFVPVGDLSMLNMSKAEIKRQTVIDALPRNSQRSNRHTVKMIKQGKKTCCYGKVYHRLPDTDGLTGQHKTVDLGNVLHLAYKNTELDSLSIGGKID